MKQTYWLFKNITFSFKTLNLPVSLMTNLNSKVGSCKDWRIEKKKKLNFVLEIDLFGAISYRRQDKK